MSDIADWINNELYPSLFEVVDRAFPEHEFTRFAGGWRSKTCSLHYSRKDKKVVSKQAPYFILEHEGVVIGLVDYVMKRDKVEFIRAVEILANVAGLKIPVNYIFSKAIAKILNDHLIMEKANNFFVKKLSDCREGDPDQFVTGSYILRRGYGEPNEWEVFEEKWKRLHAWGAHKNNEDSNYSFGETVLSMELGYIPSQEGLFQFLKSEGFTKDEIEELGIRDTRIGTTHKLTIPYRNGGRLKGFKFRAVASDFDYSNDPKYIDTIGLDKRGGFFNLSGLKGNKDLVIVEGELDALYATARG